jgi:valyl-tRNA synthetase
MCGYEVLWLPGMDHAGISTQNVVENKLWKESKKTRHDLGREKFVEEVWNWKNEYGGKIIYQFQRYGVSLDWDRFAFTLDEARTNAVREAFVRMHEKGLIYRATRLVNWCCALNTALSDLEVEYIDLTEPKKLKVPGHGDKEYDFGYLTHFLYKIKGTDKTIEVATTRLETMLGDVAVAVHPDDPRYKDLIGLELEHPFIEGRKMIIVADGELVDMNFGTGAVKITPAHDPNDFLCGERHNLEQINVFNENGTINENGGKFEGMMRFDARLEVAKELEKLGLLKETEPNPMRVGKCAKTGDIIEPLVKPQWYVNCKDLAARSVDAVRNGELKLIPDFYNDEWFRWLENIQDWCISRQLWWGHRIPAYLTKVEGIIDQPNTNNQDHWAVGRSEEDVLEQVAKKHGVTKDKVTLIQDPDVLDTWFSSGLFPFYTLGWPNEDDKDFRTFFPNHILETGHDILFFWVARMVMMSLCFNDKLPFKEVYLHPLIKDKQGKKMSKSLGNVIDPLEVIDGCDLKHLQDKLRNSNLAPKEIERGIKDKAKEFPEGIPPCGSDSLRFSLLAYMTQPRTINLDVNRIIGYRLFCTKIWNAAKMFFAYCPEGFRAGKSISDFKLSAADNWILTKLKQVIISSNKNMEDHQYGTFTNDLYDFFQKQFCDVYIEASKVALQGSDEDAKLAALNTLFTVLDNSFRLFHPMMPYITEELYQRLPYPEGAMKESIYLTDYPQDLEDFKSDEESAQKFDQANTIMGEIRSNFDNIGIQKKHKPEVTIKLGNDADVTFYEGLNETIKFMTGSGEVKIALSGSENPTGSISKCIGDDTLFIKVVGIIDIKQEIQRLQKQKGKTEKLIEGIHKKMSGKSAAMMPDSVKQENELKLQTYELQISAFDLSIETLQSLE